MVKLLLKLFLAGLVVFSLAGCGGGGGGGAGGDGNGSKKINPDNPGNPDDPHNPIDPNDPYDPGNPDKPRDPNDPNSPAKNHTLSFNLKGATLLQANKNIVTHTGAKMASGKLGAVVGGGAVYRLAASATAETNSTGSSDGDSNATVESNTTAKTNLIAIDANGSDHLAISAGELAIKVMYSVVSPKTGLVYIALSSESSEAEVNPSQIIAEHNCAIYEINASNNAYRCLAEGKMLQSYSGEYGHSITGSQKPIQFDQDGNLYFLATDFNLSGGYYENLSWSPTLYRYTIKDDALGAITHDNVSASSFAVLKNGDVVYSAYTEVGEGKSNIWLQKKGSDEVIDISGSEWGGGSFFIDDGDTIILGEGYSGYTFARAGVRGVKKTHWQAGVTASDCHDEGMGMGVDRMIVADDGHVYGMTGGTLYQVLPYDPTPIIRIEDSYSNSFQISHGFVYYKETIQNVKVDGESLGSADVIKMVDLQSRKERTILSASSEDPTRYDIYSWKLQANKLYFAALNKNSNRLVSGIIDTLKARDHNDESEFITIHNLSAVSGKIMEIQDIEPILPVRPNVDPGGNPYIVDNGLHFDNENPSSISIEFSKYMNTDSVREHISIVSEKADEGTVPFIPLWTYKTMHLFPDLSTDRLADDQGKGLTAGTTYTLKFEEGIRDLYDRELNVDGLDKVVTMAPKTGWYIGEAYGAAKGTKVAKGRSCDGGELSPIINRNIGAVKNMRVEFAIKQNAPVVQLYQINRIDENETSMDTYLRAEFASMNLAYYEKNGDDGWSEFEVPDVNISTYDWVVCRVDIYENSFNVSASEDGEHFVELYGADDLVDRNGTDYYVNISSSDRWSNVEFDDINITTLNPDGSIATTPGDILSLDFEDGQLPPEANAHVPSI